MKEVTICKEGIEKKKHSEDSSLSEEVNGRMQCFPTFLMYISNTLVNKLEASTEDHKFLM